MRKLKIKSSIETFLVMILMTILAVSVSFIIIQGQSTFERVSKNNEMDENARIALSYVNKRIKQNDISSGIEVVENGVEDYTALRISHDSIESGLFTYIFYHEGYMYECFTDFEPTINLSTKIVEVENLSFRKDNNQIIMKIDYEYNRKMIPIEQKITLRTKGEYPDEKAKD